MIILYRLTIRLIIKLSELIINYYPLMKSQHEYTMIKEQKQLMLI